MYEYIATKGSKLKNFAPKILLCVQLIVLSIRNANIVSDDKGLSFQCSHGVKHSQYRYAYIRKHCHPHCAEADSGEK